MKVGLITTIREKPPYQSGAIALGLFDGVHLGHRAVLAAAVAHCPDCTPVAFTFSTAGAVPAAKRDGRIYTDAERVTLLGEAGASYVVMPPFEEFSRMEDREFVDYLCGTLGAKAVCCGEDYHFARGAHADAGRLMELCGERGVTVHIVPPVLLDGERISSTRIRRLIREGEVGEAARLLGRPYFLDAEVMTGEKLGRKLGFPTINQRFAPGVVLPRFGVYAVSVQVGDKRYPGVANVGVKPTVGEHFAPHSETYIHGFQGDLYGKVVRVEFISFLRPEQKFSGLQELTAQISRDLRQTLILLGEEAEGALLPGSGSVAD